MPEKRHRSGAVRDAVLDELASHGAHNPVTAKSIHERVIRTLGHVPSDSVYEALRAAVERGDAAAFAPDGRGGVKRYYATPKAAAAVPPKPTPAELLAELEQLAQQNAERIAARAQVAGNAPPATPETNGHAPAIGVIEPLPACCPSCGDVLRPYRAWAELCDACRLSGEQQLDAARVSAPAVPQRIALSMGGFATSRYVADFARQDGTIELWIDALERASTNGAGPAQPSTKRLTIADAGDLRIVRAFLAALSGDGMPGAAELDELRAELAAVRAELDENRRALDDARQLLDDAAAAEQRATVAEKELAALRERLRPLLALAS